MERTAWYKKKRVAVGKHRWVTYWETPKAGHPGGDECSDHFIEDCYDGHSRVLPNRGMAEALAQKIANEGATMWGCAGVVEQVFESYEGDPTIGFWDQIGDRKDFYWVEPAAPAPKDLT